jgi:hypothetical protein
LSPACMKGKYYSLPKNIYTTQRSIGRIWHHGSWHHHGYVNNTILLFSSNSVL